MTRRPSLLRVACLSLLLCVAGAGVAWATAPTGQAKGPAPNSVERYVKAQLYLADLVRAAGSLRELQDNITSDTLLLVDISGTADFDLPFSVPFFGLTAGPQTWPDARR